MDIYQVAKSSSITPPTTAQDVAQQAMHHVYISSNPNQGGGQSDSVQLSQESNFLNGVNQGPLEWGVPIKTNPPIPHTAEQLNTWFSDFRDAVRKSIEKIFTQNNIQLQQPVTLQNNADGTIQVDGTHPQAQQIQNLLDQTPQIGDQLQTLNQRSDLYQVLAHGNDLRYASNDNEHSQAAAALSDHLNNPAPFRITISPSAPAAAPSANQG